MAVLKPDWRQGLKGAGERRALFHFIASAIVVACEPPMDHPAEGSSACIDRSDDNG